MLSLAEQIENMIVERNLGEGARLPPERALAAEFGVSRSRLREAIQHLVSRGIVTSRQGGGTYVAQRAAILSLDRALKPLEPLVRGDAGYWHDVMEIRKSLDKDAAYYAAMRANDADKLRLKQALAAVSASTAAEPRIQAQADAAFHMVIAEASHNLVLRQVVAGLSELLQESIAESLTKLYRVPATVEALDRQHALIIEAILAGRPEEARKAAADHLAYVEDSLRSIEEGIARERRSATAVQTSTLQQETSS